MPHSSSVLPKHRDAFKRRGLVTADDIVPMGVKEALALIEREEAQATQPAKRGVVAWVADRFRRKLKGSGSIKPQ